MNYQEIVEDIVLENHLVDILYVGETEGMFALNRKQEVVHIKGFPVSAVPVLAQERANEELAIWARGFGKTREKALEVLRHNIGRCFSDVEAEMEELSFDGWSDADVVRFYFGNAVAAATA